LKLHVDTVGVLPRFIKLFEQFYYILGTGDEGVAYQKNANGKPFHRRDMWFN
jgi:hypothetical protein